MALDSPRLPKHAFLSSRRRLGLVGLALAAAVVLRAHFTRPPALDKAGCKCPKQQPAALVAGGGAAPTAEQALGIEHLEQAAVERVQADPSLLHRQPQLLRQFEAAPWLLPPRTAALPYAGVHDLDALAALRAQQQGGLERTLSLLLFNRDMAVMLQNCLYSLVKFARVTNYIVGTWTEADMEACKDLNLPCADVSAYLPVPLHENETAYGHGSRQYIVTCWLRAPIVSHLLSLGYVVHLSDVDIAYTAKPLWDSYVNLLAVSGADAAFMWENGIANGGQHVSLPTPGGRHMFEAWSASAPGFIAEMKNDQEGLATLMPEHWEMGWLGARHCHSLREAADRENATKAIVRTFWPPQFLNDADSCAFNSVERAPFIDTCYWAVLFLHPQCNTELAVKRGVMVKLGFWFMDDGEGEGCPADESTASRAPRCRPLRWRDPAAEAVHLGCRHRRFALTSEVASEEQMERLLRRVREG